MCIIYKHGRSEVCLPLESSPLVDNIYQLVTNIEDVPRSNFYLTFNGKCLESDVVIASPCTVRFRLRLPGGKGGFGSMLRAIGARIEKTTNHEACRDLSGRRMRDVNYEKEMGEWLKQKEKEKDDENNGEKQKQRIEKLEKIINPKHNYQDEGYTTNLQNNAEKIDEALKIALQKRDGKINLKRKVFHESGKQKKSRIWMGVEEEDSDDDGEDIVAVVTEDQPSCSKESMVDVMHERNLQKQVDPCSDGIDVDTCCSSSPVENTELSNSVIEGGNLVSPSTKTVEEEALSKTDSSSTCESSSVSSLVTENDKEDNDPKSAAPTSTSAAMIQGSVDMEMNQRVVNLQDFECAENLESVGLDALKTSLMALGLKCGGTLEERAQRLFLTKNVPPGQLDPSLFAKPSRGKKKKQKK